MQIRHTITGLFIASAAAAGTAQAAPSAPAQVPEPGSLALAGLGALLLGQRRRAR